MDINIPLPEDVLTEIPTEGDCLDFSEPVQDESIDSILQEIEGYYMDDYYHEEY